MEEAWKIENQKLISSFLSYYEDESDMLGTTLLGTGTKQQEVTANEKLQALKKSYEDPQINTLNLIISEQEQKNDAVVQTPQEY